MSRRAVPSVAGRRTVVGLAGRALLIAALMWLAVGIRAGQGVTR